ncbi:MAG: hypothetical protein PHQ40_16230 [Anaerolineaceae bacterium]|nr:hypothetical protein [Anaerolineaceae bacterium]
MLDPEIPLERFWDNLLSGQPEKVRQTYCSVDESSKAAALAHLKRMATEKGWRPSQKVAALAALEALRE